MNNCFVSSSSFAALLFAGLVCIASPADAGGLGIPGYGSQAQPRAGAFVAKADDPSAIFHNPAGLVKLSGTVIQLGINLINFSQSFQRAGNYDQCTGAKCPAGGVSYAGQAYEKVENQSHGKFSIGDYAVVPLFSVASDLGLDLPFVFAAGIFAPVAGSPDREYSPEYVLGQDPTIAPPPGRYDIIRQEVAVILPSLALGYRVNSKWSVGARISWGFGSLKGATSTWGERNYEEWDGLDAVFEVDVKDNFVPAFGVGALYKPKDNLELGFNYRSAASVHASGTGTPTSGQGLLLGGQDPLSPKTQAPYVCGPGGDIVAFTTCVNIELPRMASVGARWFSEDSKGRERADIELDVQWENWSAASQTVNLVDAITPAAVEGLPPSVIRHGFKDVFSIRLGGSYTHAIGDNLLSIRAGLAHDTETAETSWTRLDQDGFARDTLALGTAFELPGWRFELSGGVVLEGSRTVDHGGCNPTANDIGCNGDGFETPVGRRDAPDPAQPTAFDRDQSQSPFNAGVYEQGYVFLGMGVTAWF